MRFNYLIFFSILITLFSCKNDIDPIVEESNSEAPFIDSDLSLYTPLQLYSQHVIFKIPIEFQSNIDSLSKWIEATQPGGLIFEDWTLEKIQELHFSIDTLDIIQPFILDSYWNHVNSKPYVYSRANSELQDVKYSQLFCESGINLIDFGTFKDSIDNDKTFYSIDNEFPTVEKKNDYINFINAIQNSSRFIRLNISNRDTVNFEGYRDQFKFKGLFISTIKNNSLAIENGTDFVIQNNINVSDFNNFKTNEIVEKSTKRILNFKAQLVKERENKSAIALQKYTNLNFQQKATTLVSNKKNLLPTKSITKQKVKDFTKKSIKNLASKKGNKFVVLPDTLTEIELENFKSINAKDNLVICFSNPSYYSQLNKVPNLVFVPPVAEINESILKQQFTGHISFEGDFIYENQKIEGVKIKSTQLSRTPPEFVGLDSEKLRNVKYLISNAMNGRSFPGCQVLAAKNGSIIYDQYFGHHTYKREIVVKQNSVYDIASLTKVVSTTLMSMKLYEMGKFDLYDSLEIYFPDTLKDYLDLPSTIRHVTFQELLIHKSGLPAGFPIFRYMQYTSSEIGRFDKYYCDSEDECFSTPVAEDFFLEKEYQDSMWIQLHKIWINDAKPYKYSDVNMNTMYFMLKSMIENHPKDFDFNDSKKKLEGRNLYVEYLYKIFYKPLEMSSTYYQPTNHISKNRLVPTENESYWRKQLLQGYVHDPNSALHGGIAGNAGIFTTTNDLVKLLQMWLNKGVYDNNRYLNAETIDHFTSTQPESHRGLGFNKRTLTNAAYAMADSASANTYGHTGFTGTCFWVDPDNEVVYIFLANRVHPKVNNRMYQYGIRKNVHQVFYDAFLE